MTKNWDNLIKHKEHKIRRGDIEIIVHDEVFTPDQNLTYSTEQTLAYLDNLNLEEKEILDLGCGTGIIGISCLSKGAKKVTFSDVSSKALENTFENLKLNTFLNKAEIIQSNLFENIHGDFDFIFANLPISNDLWQPVIKQTTETLTEKFLKEVRSFTRENGRIIINWASFASLEQIENYLNENNFKFKKIEQEALDCTWYLFDIEINKNNTH
jgi:methylase of polypeptide subunit release factors